MRRRDKWRWHGSLPKATISSRSLVRRRSRYISLLFHHPHAWRPRCLTRSLFSTSRRIWMHWKSNSRLRRLQKSEKSRRELMLLKKTATHRLWKIRSSRTPPHSKCNPVRHENKVCSSWTPLHCKFNPVKLATTVQWNKILPMKASRTRGSYRCSWFAASNQSLPLAPLVNCAGNAENQVFSFTKWPSVSRWSYGSAWSLRPRVVYER